VVTIALPPLRERREDIVPLFEHFSLVSAVRYQRPAPILSEAQRQALAQRPWPGNVRELRNAADRMVLGVPEGGQAGAQAAAPDETAPLRERMEHFERAVIADALARTGGAVSQAADLLQVGKATLYDKIKRYGL
jgi:two-component system C4-dicarboxylate transport response regulator DctD